MGHFHPSGAKVWITVISKPFLITPTEDLKMANGLKREIPRIRSE